MFASRILILIPHPDDEVVGAFAAIERARARGSTVLGAYLTTGVPAAEVLWPWERSGHAGRVSVRWGEARRAASLLGIQPAMRQLVPTRRLKDHLGPTRERLLDLIGAMGVEVLWTPAYEGGHQDHDTASFLAGTLKDLVEVWEFSEYNLSGRRARSQEFPRAIGGERELLLDGAQRDRKRAALAIYASERGNLRHIRPDREVFRPLPLHDFSRPPHPGKLFYQRFQWVPRHPRIDHTHPEEVCRAFLSFRRRTVQHGRREDAAGEREEDRTER